MCMLHSMGALVVKTSRKCCKCSLTNPPFSQNGTSVLNSLHPSAIAVSLSVFMTRCRGFGDYCWWWLWRWSCHLVVALTKRPVPPLIP